MGRQRITVLGNFSGRNAGDNAILGNLLRDVYTLCPKAEFVIPTLDARFVRAAFGQYPIKALGMMPWNGAIKILGLPTLRAMLNTDLVLITDNILFDRAYYNPAFNYLSTVSAIAPFCRHRGIPLVLYNASVGPITTGRGKRALQRVLDASPVSILRDRRSLELLKELGLDCPEIVMGADCALNTQLPDRDHLDAILSSLVADYSRETTFVGVNINTYLGSWEEKTPRGAASTFTSLIASVVNQLARDVRAQVMLFVTQVMDHRITVDLKRKLTDVNAIAVVSNPQFTFDEIAGLLSRMDMLVAMRTHAQILAASVGTPVVNINSYPKSRGFLETIGMEQWSIDVADLSEPGLLNLTRKAWEARADTRTRLASEVEREREKARSAAAVISRLLHGR